VPVLRVVTQRTPRHEQGQSGISKQRKVNKETGKLVRVKVSICGPFTEYPERSKEVSLDIEGLGG